MLNRWKTFCPSTLRTLTSTPFCRVRSAEEGCSHRLLCPSLQNFCISFGCSRVSICSSDWCCCFIGWHARVGICVNRSSRWSVTNVCQGQPASPTHTLDSHQGSTVSIPWDMNNWTRSGSRALKVIINLHSSDENTIRSPRIIATYPCRATW